MKYLKQMLAHNKKRSLFGNYVQQSWASLWVIEQMLSAHKPDRIAELGSGNGLLSTYLWAYTQMEMPSHMIKPGFMTIDVDLSKSKSTLYPAKKADIYAKETVQKILNFLGNGTRPFLLVDGLDPKSAEVNLYAPDLKSGTVIFAHDCILEGSTGAVKKWLFPESQIDWKHVRRLEPYYSMGVELDTRMLALERV